MSKTVLGVDRIRRKFGKLGLATKREIDAANKRTGDELIRMSRILHPGDGETKAEIHGSQNADGSYLADFGSKSKVTEGRRGPRPFVNPALKVLRKKHRARARRALNKAVKQSFNG